MYFCLFGLVLLVFAETNRASARKIRVDRLPSGNDQFEVLEDDEKHICTSTEKATEFCAKYGAISVKNTRTCLGLQESLHCRCNSTKSTFLLHEERCVDKENVSRYLRAVMLPECKYQLAVQDGNTPRHCDKSPVPKLLTNTSDIRRFSHCTEHALRKVVSCKPDMNNSMYFNKGRWKRMWRLDPKEKSMSGSSLKTLLLKLRSNDSPWSGFIVSLKATCLVQPEISPILRGQSPPEEVKTCLLLKISGSRLLTLKSHQMSVNFTQSNIIVSSLIRNKTSHGSGRNNTKSEKNDTEVNLTATPRSPTTSTEKVNLKVDELSNSSSWQLTSALLGAFVGVLVFLMFIVACWLFRRGHCRRKAGRDEVGRDEAGRIKTQRSCSIGNPTYERGVDNSLTRTSFIAGDHVYETIKSIRENPTPRRYETWDGYEIPVDGIVAIKSPSVTNNNNFATNDLNKQCTCKPSGSKQSLRRDSTLDGEKGLTIVNLTDFSQSNSYLSLQDEGTTLGIETVTHSSFLSSSPQKYDNEDFGDKKQTPKSRGESQKHCEIADTCTCSSISCECGTVHDGLHDSSSEHRLSSLEIVVDSDCSDCDETESQSDRFYYVLEGPDHDKTSTL